MEDDGATLERLQKELNYYKRQLDQMAGESLRLDYVISGLRHELKQKRRGMELLSRLQQAVGSHRDLHSIFDATIRAINSTLSMDKTVILTPTDQDNQYRPSHWIGFEDETARAFSSLSLPCPPECFRAGGHLLVNSSSEVNPGIIRLREAFGLPWFICLPILGETTPAGLLISGRLKESKPLWPPLDSGDVDTFEGIAGQISAFLRQKRLMRLDGEIEIASQIQRELLPKSAPLVPYLDVAASTLACHQVGGDCFDVIELPESRYGFFVADVSGKGIPASLLATLLQGVLYLMAKLDMPLAEAARHANQYLYERSEDMRYATLFYGVLDPAGALEYVNAGHVSALIRCASGELLELPSENFPVGIFPDTKFVGARVTLSPGDFLLVYSDGITEATNRGGEEFGVERLSAAVRAFPGTTAGEFAEAIRGEVGNFTGGAPQADDITLVVIQYRGGSLSLQQRLSLVTPFRID